MSFRDLEDTYKPLGLTTFDEFEDNREEAIQMYAYAPDIRRRFLGDHALIAILFAVRNPVVKVDRRRRGRLKVRYYGDFVFFFSQLLARVCANTHPRVSIGEEEEISAETPFMYFYQCRYYIPDNVLCFPVHRLRLNTVPDRGNQPSVHGFISCKEIFQLTLSIVGQGSGNDIG